jgi:hypothetical protein
MYIRYIPFAFFTKIIGNPYTLVNRRISPFLRSISIYSIYLRSFLFNIGYKLILIGAISPILIL